MVLISIEECSSTWPVSGATSSLGGAGSEGASAFAAISHRGQGLSEIMSNGNVSTSTVAAHAAAAVGPRRRNNRKMAAPTKENIATCTVNQKSEATLMGTPET
jgi:hypothetical protein